MSNVFNNFNVSKAHELFSNSISVSNHATAFHVLGNNLLIVIFIKFSLCHKGIFVLNCKCLGLSDDVRVNSWSPYANSVK